MSRKLCTQIKLLVTYVMSLVYFLRSYPKIKQALQWWSWRQSVKLFLEAEEIRDGLLQETFIIRRHLDLLTVNHPNSLTTETQECLKKIDQLHHSLVKLSDRLFPASLQDSLPLAIECLLKPLLISYPSQYFYIDMPASWRHEPAERSMIILRALEELLIITIPEVVTPISIYISLKKQGNLAQLIVTISYPDVSTLVFYSHLPELDYLGESFRFLTGGECFYHSQNFNAIWSFYW
ncbi:MAG: hypothetical protein EA343_24300 [Nodularia sp. (in: Bacteria)]|nr:MAG: hypothetical protein EA343_24300 [Nodularia sp. (in: cyanobacteria)]